MSPTVAAWIVIAIVAAVVAVVALIMRRRADVRRASGPRGVGEALEHGRRRVRDVHPDD